MDRGEHGGRSKVLRELLPFPKSSTESSRTFLPRKVLEKPPRKLTTKFSFTKLEVIVYDIGFREAVSFSADELIFFVSFTCEEHDIAFT